MKINRDRLCEKSAEAVTSGKWALYKYVNYVMYMMNTVERMFTVTSILFVYL